MTTFWDTLLSDRSDASDATNPFNTQLQGLPYRANVLLNKKVTSLASLAETGCRTINELASPDSGQKMPVSRHYDDLERQAIQSESEQPIDDDPFGTAGVPGFDGLPDLTPEQHGAIRADLLHRAAARALLQAIREAGMYARIDDQGRLRVGPSSMVWESDRRTITRYRDALVDLLTHEEAPR